MQSLATFFFLTSTKYVDYCCSLSGFSRIKRIEILLESVKTLLKLKKGGSRYYKVCSDVAVPLDLQLLNQMNVFLFSQQFYAPANKMERMR